MAESRDLARRIVEYDETLARDLLAFVCSQLGGPRELAEAEVERLRAFLSEPDTAQSRALRRLSVADDADATTSEWKSEFAHSERLRSLGLALAERLAAGSR